MINQGVSTISTGLQYADCISYRGVRTPTSRKKKQKKKQKKERLGMTLTFIWWWGPSSGALRSVEYHFIAITGVVIPVMVTSTG